jgi:hypothetical protein
VSLYSDLSYRLRIRNWLILPTVTQALIRKIILSLGLSRDSLHYNRQTEFFPLAHLADDESTDLDSIFDSLALNVYDHIKKQQDKNLKSRRGIVPTYQPNQIEFLVDQTPSPAGVSSVLKTPNVGTYRIDSMEEKNVSLTELQTGKQVNSHIELIRPVSLKEFKLILANQWDLHSQYTKAAKPMPTRCSFLAAHPLDKNAIIQVENTPEKIEDEFDLPVFFIEPDQGKQRIPDPEPQHGPAPTPDPNPPCHADPALTPELQIRQLTFLTWSRMILRIQCQIRHRLRMRFQIQGQSCNMLWIMIHNPLFRKIPHIVCMAILKMNFFNLTLFASMRM